MSVRMPVSAVFPLIYIYNLSDDVCGKRTCVMLYRSCGVSLRPCDCRASSFEADSVGSYSMPIAHLRNFRWRASRSRSD